MKQKLAIFGGTFDPVHLGHIEMAKQARRLAYLDGVVFLPCRASPHKMKAPGASPTQRLDMIKIATKSMRWIEVSRWEIDRMPPSYSWMAAEHFTQVFPNAELFWILGDDQWEKIHTWSKPGKLAELLTFIVIRRGKRPMKKAGYRCQIVDLSNSGSSTEARRRIAGGKDTGGLLDRDVAGYIAKNGLYGAPPT